MALRRISMVLLVVSVRARVGVPAKFLKTCADRINQLCHCDLRANFCLVELVRLFDSATKLHYRLRLGYPSSVVGLLPERHFKRFVILIACGNEISLEERPSSSHNSVYTKFPTPKPSYTYFQTRPTSDCSDKSIGEYLPRGMNNAIKKRASKLQLSLF